MTVAAIVPVPILSTGSYGMYRHSGRRNCGKIDGWAKIAAGARIDGRGGPPRNRMTNGAAKHAGSWEKTLKFRALDARNTAKAGELACKNFPDFRVFRL